jgi:hypothetical protein
MKCACAIFSSVAYLAVLRSPHFLINGMNLELEFRMKNNLAMCYRKYILTFSYSTGYSCGILMGLSFSRKNFEKFSSVKFNEGRRLDRQTDRQTHMQHEDVNCNFQQFYESE